MDVAGHWLLDKYIGPARKCQCINLMSFDLSNVICATCYKWPMCMFECIIIFVQIPYADLSKQHHKLYEG